MVKTPKFHLNAHIRYNLHFLIALVKTFSMIYNLIFWTSALFIVFGNDIIMASLLVIWSSKFAYFVEFTKDF